MNRRKFITSVGIIGFGSIAGCLGSKERTYDLVESLPQPTKGEDTAPVTVKTFEDLGCPHCRTFHQEVYPKIVSQFVDSGDVQIQWFDFPVPVREQSDNAANAARAVQDADGDESFWEFVTVLFQNQDSLGRELYSTAAEELGIDGEMVATKAMEKTYQPVIDENKRTGTEEYDIPGTPGIIINDKGPLGDPSFGSVSREIQNALRNS